MYPFVNRRNAVLRKIAVVNLKKVDGASTSSDNDLMQYTKDNAATLRREVAHVQPRIIVCGGTFKSLRQSRTEKSARYRQV